MSEFLAMGGYGAFVWSAYAFTLAVMVGLAVFSVRSARRKAAEIEALRQLRATGADPIEAPRQRIARRADEATPPAG